MGKFITPPKGSPIEIPQFSFKDQYQILRRRPLISMDGLELVKDFEGCALEAYIDPVGVPTIGFGRIVYPNGQRVRPFDVCSLEKAFEWLFEDLAGEGAKYVAAFAKRAVSLSDCQWSALVSFTYNRGAGRFHEKLAALVDAGLADQHFDQSELRLVSSTMLQYDWAGSKNNRKKLLGLTRRRYAEREMFLGGNWRKFTGPKWQLQIPRMLLGA